jgi:hypothetical protein
VKSSSGNTFPCLCTEAQLDQFLSETYQDQKLVTKMLFLHRSSEDAIQPMDKRVATTAELQTLYQWT